MKKFEIEEVEIINFRNFENIKIKTSQKNVIIGVNDIGKTNFLYALRMVFDYSVRNREIVDSDFYKKNTAIDFKINITCDIENTEDKNVQKVLTEVGPLNKGGGKLKIFLTGNIENGISMEWEIGSIKEPIPNEGVNRNKLDKIFTVYYIPPHNDIEKKFREIKNRIIKENCKKNGADLVSENKVKDLQDKIRTEINKTSAVSAIQKTIGEELKKFNVSYDPRIASNVGLKSIYEELDIYLISKDERELDLKELVYPATGDGRKKTLLYAMYLYEIENNYDKVPLILVEEPENHLFINNQILLSKVIFETEVFANTFITTHSPQLMYHLTKGTNIIKILKEDSKSISKSEVFIIPKEFDSLKNKFQRDIANAVFSKRILLVEGYSEKLLFDYIIEHKIECIETINDLAILNIIGVDFKPYYNFLKKLGVEVLVKTDNDIKKNGTNIELSGLNRLNQLASKDNLGNIKGEIKAKKDEDNEDKQKRLEITRSVYDDKTARIKELEELGLFISKIDFENDLAEAILIPEEREDFIKGLQSSKWHNLNDSEYSDKIFTEDSINKIYESEYFKCLKVLVEGKEVQDGV